MTESIRIPIGPSGSPIAWATVDLRDYERLIIHRWYLSGTGKGYAFRTSDHKSVFMHREVLEFPDSEAVNHINGDQLDNRRSNLEACTHAHNVREGSLGTVFRIRDLVRDLRGQGWTNRRIARELKVSEASVVKYAGDLPKAPHPTSIWTRDRLIEWTQNFHAEHDRLPAMRDYAGNGAPWWVQIYRVFPGGMKELRVAAGFGPVDLRKRVSA